MAVGNDIGKFISRLTKSFDRSVSRETFKALALEAIKMVQIRTRLGYGVAKNGGKRFRLKPLSPGYVRFRKKHRKELHKFARPTRSNLTFTGQMLGSMGIVKLIRKEVVISPTGRRNDGLTNKQVAEEVAKKGRSFNRLSDLEFKKLRRFYENTVKQEIKRRR